MVQQVKAPALSLQWLVALEFPPAAGTAQEKKKKKMYFPVISEGPQMGPHVYPQIILSAAVTTGYWPPPWPARLRPCLRNPF